MWDLKDEVEEIKFTNGESEEDDQLWAQEIELKITEADSKVSELRERINYIEGNLNLKLKKQHGLLRKMTDKGD